MMTTEDESGETMRGWTRAGTALELGVDCWRRKALGVVVAETDYEEEEEKEMMEEKEMKEWRN